MKPISSDTICAIATPVGVAGVGIIRVSGQTSLDLVRTCFSKKGTFKPRYVYTGKFLSHKQKKFIDSVCVVYFEGPSSYTGENVVEIHCHSSIYILKAILEELLILGARMAREGEFTKRAFINGKLDLTQAESVIDLIHSESEMSHHVSLAHVTGVLSDFISTIRNPIKELLEQVEGSIDFPDEVDSINKKEVSISFSHLHKTLKTTLSYQDLGEMVMGGINVLIVGKPNTGKSSLFNLLLGKDRAIVSDMPGTTRDYLEASYDFKGYRFNLFDSAGVRESSDIIEQLGIDRIKSLLGTAHLVCWCIDQSDLLTEDDEKVFAAIKQHQNVIILQTKSDLSSKIKQSDLTRFSYSNLKVSIHDKASSKVIKSLFYTNSIKESDKVNLDLLCNVRQKACLQQLEKWIEAFVIDLENSIDDDLLAIDLKKGLEICSEFTGEALTEEVLDGIFSRFCVGK